MLVLIVGAFGIGDLTSSAVDMDALRAQSGENLCGCKSGGVDIGWVGVGYDVRLEESSQLCTVNRFVLF